MIYENFCYGILAGLYYGILIDFEDNSFRKGKVKNPRDYKYSSLRCYLENGYKSSLKVTIHNIFKDLGENFKARLNIFLDLEYKYREKLLPI